MIDVPAWDLSSTLQGGLGDTDALRGGSARHGSRYWRTMVRTTSGVMNPNMRRKVAFGGRQRRLEEEG